MRSSYKKLYIYKNARNKILISVLSILAEISLRNHELKFKNLLLFLIKKLVQISPALL